VEERLSNAPPNERETALSKPLLRVLSGETVDPPPLWLMRQAGRYLPEYRAVRARARDFLDMVYTPDVAVEVTLQPLRRYGMDAAILFSDILVVPDALGQKVAFVQGEGPVLEPLRVAADVDRLDSSGLHQRLAPVYETVRCLAAGLDDKTALIGFAGAPWTVAVYMVEGRGGTDHATIRRWAYRDPDGFGRLIDVLVDATVAYLSRQIDAGAEVVQLFDTWAGVLPEAPFRRWCIEPTRAIVEQLRRDHPGVPVIGFPRGAGALYADYVSQTGVTAVGMDSGVPLSWAVEHLQSKAAVQGNLDNQLLVSGGDALDREVDRLLAAFRRGPYIFNLGHGIVPDTPPDHVARLVERVRRG
jgi:uroporphyrinogen decarboxylase